ncbi:penicillin-binding protein activator [Candidatus Bathyarchaeota archaeon]|nr:penicillin-binding protein activator [Candidatus Bathyarchaeota archaeon]
MSAQMPRLLAFLVIGLVIGAGVAYAYMSSVMSTAYADLNTTINNLNSKISQLQDQINRLNQTLEYSIGVTLPLTGALTDVGVQWRTVVEMAFEDLNKEMQKYKMRVKFTPIIQDDKTTDTQALANVQTFHQAGIKVIIGPAASFQVKAIKSYVDDNKIVVLSPSSTAPTLAIPDDYIYRTVGSDAGQAKALAALVKSQGINKVIVFHRDDEYGVAFEDFFEREFSALGGTSIGMKYDVTREDFASEVAQLSARTRQEGVEGIVIITFDTDGVNILSHARKDSYLASLRWFSSEGIHGAMGLLGEDIATFIQKTNLLGTRPLFRENPLLHAFASQYRDKTGIDPPVFSANLYDAVMLAGWAVVRAGVYEGEAIRSALDEVAKNYYGVSGLTMFDENGDKLFQDYSVWTVKLVSGEYRYVDVGSYSGGVITLEE